jgi:hypothetical protein
MFDNQIVAEIPLEWGETVINVDRSTADFIIAHAWDFSDSVKQL